MVTLFLPRQGESRLLGVLPPRSRAIRIPASWHEVTLRQFVLLCTSTDYDDPAIFQFSLLTGLTWGECQDLPIDFITRTMSREFKFIQTPYVPPEGVTKDVTFRIGKREYTYYSSYMVSPLVRYILIEKLVLLREIEVQRLRSGDFSRLSFLIALLVTDKIGNPARIVDFQGNAKEFEKMPCDTALDILVFFLRASRVSNVNLRYYLALQTIRLRTKNRPTLNTLIGMPLSPN